MNGDRYFNNNKTMVQVMLNKREFKYRIYGLNEIIYLMLNSRLNDFIKQG